MDGGLVISWGRGWEILKMPVSNGVQLKPSANLNSVIPRENGYGESPSLFPVPVIPAKAGIQTIAAKPAIRNQVQIAVDGSPLPSRERARVRVRRAQARLCGRDARAPRGKLPL